MQTTLEEVAAGIYSYVQLDGGWCLNNAGLVAAGDNAVLIDTAATERRARSLRDAVTKVVPDGPGILVNTHHHGDHVFGNAQFVPRATIVAHERTRTEMIESGLGLRLLWPDVEWGETPLTLPTLTFRDEITLYAGELELRLIYLGPAHTTNDVVIWVPERKVLFSGDILMSNVTPFCLMGSIEGALRAIERLRALAPEIIVPGHGPVGGPELFAANESYLRFIQQLAAEGQASGLSALDAARAAELGDFAELKDSERIVGNLQRAYADMSGEPLGAPLDILGSFQDMLAYHGRLPDCHA